MKKVFIDTNIFLKLYDCSEDDFQVQKSNILLLEQYLVIPTQIFSEFLRNRVKIIEEIKKSFKTIETIRKFALLKNTFVQEQKRLFKEYNKYINATIITALDNMINDQKSDQNYKLILELMDSEKVKKINTEDSTIIKNAHDRFLLGMPPTSNGNKICDQVIWESLLTIKEDLIIVSKDKTYKDNEEMLVDEYNRKTGRNLMIFSNISDALRENNIAPEKSLIEIENDMNSNIMKSLDKDIRSKTISLLIEALIDVDFCPRCYKTTYHSGTMCTECGYRNCD